MGFSFHRKVILLLALCVAGLDAFNLQFAYTSTNYFKSLSTSNYIASNVNITSRDQNITSVYGQALANYDGSSYTLFNIHSLTAYYIPLNMGQALPNLKGLCISSSKLKELEKRDLEQFPKLQELRITSNYLEHLPSDLFEGNPELTHVYLSSNQISYVAPELLVPLKKLTVVDLSSNRCISKAYGSGQSYALT
jgi:Leucine-rich repeat (LRR) protein